MIFSLAKPIRRHRRNREEQLHLAVMKWVFLNETRHPELKLMFHPANGGYRHKATAAKFQRMGVRPGVPDLFLAVPRGQYHGMWIELKAERGNLSAAQCSWLMALESLGYYTCVVRDVITAIREIEGYLK